MVNTGISFLIFLFRPSQIKSFLIIGLVSNFLMHLVREWHILCTIRLQLHHMFTITSGEFIFLKLDKISFFQCSQQLSLVWSIWTKVRYSKHLTMLSRLWLSNKYDAIVTFWTNIFFTIHFIKLLTWMLNSMLLLNLQKKEEKLWVLFFAPKRYKYFVENPFFSFSF